MSLHIESDQYVNEDPEIEINGFSLVNYNKDQIELQIDFASPNDITKDASSPDSIFLKCKNNMFFIDEKDKLIVPLDY